MIFEYEKPVAEIVSFMALEKLAVDDDRSRSSDGGGDVNLPGSMPTIGSEGVENW